MTIEFNTVSNLKFSYNLLRKFKYNRYFTKDGIKKIPQGWIYHEDQHKYITGNLINKNLIDLTKQIIFIKPDIWGDAILNSEYWKDDSLSS